MPILEMKDRQKQKRQQTRVMTTSKRVAARQADLQQAFSEAKNVQDLKPVYQQLQANREEEATTAKRELAAQAPPRQKKKKRRRQSSHSPVRQPLKINESSSK